MKNKNVVLGILGGAALGLVAGVLMAPDKGSNTRRKLADQGSGLKNNLKSSFDKWSASLNDTVDNLKAEAEEMIAEATRKYKEEKAKFEADKEA